MTASADLLSNFERCARWGHWSRSWVRHRMSPMEMFHSAVNDGLVTDAPDPGELAGELMMGLAADRGLELAKSHNVYRCAINHAAAADLVVTAIRLNGERWAFPEFPSKNPSGWISSALMSPDGGRLRRFLAVSSWSEDRAFYEKHSWYCLGEIAHYRMPMQLAVAVLGPMNGGRRHGHFSKALLHPQGSELRFRLRRRSKVEGFRETWVTVYREEHDEIDRQKWLACMFQDEVLQDSLFVIDIPVPEETQLAAIRDLASRQLERLAATDALPPKQLMTCSNPLAPCPFRACCWGDPEGPPDAGGYDRV